MPTIPANTRIIVTQNCTGSNYKLSCLLALTRPLQERLIVAVSEGNVLKGKALHSDGLTPR